MNDKRQIRKLILVFNADAGRLDAIIDSAKKLFKIKGCTLCSITHGLAGEKQEWHDCKDELGVAVDYLHRDEIGGSLAELVGDRLPCVLADTSDGLVMLLTPEVLDRCKGSVADFRGRLSTHAAMHNLSLPYS